MSQTASRLSRRRFLTTAAQVAGALTLPTFLPGKVLGKNGITPPSEQITVGGIGIGHRGSYDLGCFLEQPDVRFVAVCDVKAARREAVKKTVDTHHHNAACATYRDLRDILARKDIDAVLIATGPNWHATAAMLAANAGKDIYCEKPCTKNISQSLILAETIRRTGQIFQAGTQRRNLPHVQFAVQLAQRGKLGKLHTVYAHPAGMTAMQSGWATPEKEPKKEDVDWDLYLGPSAWRPFNSAFLDGFNFEKGGGLVGGGVLEWGSHCVDMCQWAADADGTAPIEYNPPKNGEIVCRYASGVRLIFREEGWLPLGSCPVRFEGDSGWVETGDSGKLILSSPELFAGHKVAEIGGYPATFHVRDFLDCVKSRGKPKCNADVACYGHIACHAANTALFLNRKLNFDPVKCEFIADDAANRLRSEAIRDPWKL